MSEPEDKPELPERPRDPESPREVNPGDPGPPVLVPAEHEDPRRDPRLPGEVVPTPGV
jgi:hypothetical protein